MQPEKEIFPPFDLPAETVPAWLTQSRERFDLPALDAVTPLDGSVTIVLLPAAGVLLAALGVWRFRAWAFLLLPVGGLACPGLLRIRGSGLQLLRADGRCSRSPPILAVLASFGLVAVAVWIRARAAPRRRRAPVSRPRPA